MSYQSPAHIRARGIGLATEDYILLFETAIAAANGLGMEPALRAITISHAKILGIDDRAGSLAKGKDADIAVFDGDPFEYTSHVQEVLVQGEVMYQRGQ